jgi:oxygen-dependent protoporphyrinogen oxidase
MLMASKRGFSVRGFTWTDQKWQGRAPEGFALVRGYFSGVTAEQDELIRLAMADLQTLWGRVPEVRHSWVFQWKEGLPQYTVGHLERAQQALSAEDLPGLFLVGAAYQGVGLPEVVRMAKERAVKTAAFLKN